MNGNIHFIGDMTAPFDAGTTAIYECNQGYKLDGDESERLCTQENLFFDWTETAPTCVCKYSVNKVDNVFNVLSKGAINYNKAN